MPAFLFAFGYEEPDGLEYNSRHGTDHESSTAVFIEAATSSDALAWGQEIAEAFVGHRYADDAVSWKAMGYAHWLVERPEASDWAHCLDFFPKVAHGELPDPAALTTEAYDAWMRESGSARKPDAD